ncbi:MAG: hypothetical protein HS129_04325 [Leptospiraceae bacterium]|nr:hypothetical protein [Leptospiraceae bacterium]
MRKSLVALSIFIFYAFPIFPEEKEKIWHYEKLTIRENPEKRPKAIQQEFIPEGGKLLYSTEFRGSFGDSIESVLIFSHSFDLVALNLFYELVLKNLEWKILQKDIQDKKSVYLAEGPARRMVTILLTDEKEYRSIKIFLKKAMLF